MAGRTLNRRELRKQADQADQRAAEAPDAAVVVAPPAKKGAKAKAKAPAGAKPKRTRAKKAPPRMRARWGVFDAAMKQVAVFDFNQRGAAEQKLADLLARKKGEHFLQIVKEPMPEPEPAEAPVA